jgi:hypothetical protein
MGQASVETWYFNLGANIGRINFVHCLAFPLHGYLKVGQLDEVVSCIASLSAC